MNSYETAAAALPRPEKPLDDPDDNARFNRYSSTRTSGLQTPTERRHMQHTDIFSPLSPMPQKCFTRKSIGALIPSPLHIHKDTGILDSPATPPSSKTMNQLLNLSNGVVKAPPFTPPRNITPSTPPSSARRLSVTFSASSYTWLQQRSCEHYDRVLADFGIMLHGHIAAVENLLAEIKDIQSKKSVRGVASFGEDKGARKADLHVRIVRLRAKDWRRERFDPERYENLCTMALAEL
ncbi:MAG: hypothetical protein Q9196_004287 [Gyalolechia fulgens]